MTVSSTERVAWIQLRQVPQLGPVRMLRLIRAFESAQAVFEQSVEVLRREGVPEAVARNIVQSRGDENLAAARKQMDRAEKAGCRLLLYTEPDYPLNLKKVYAPPPYLYVRGTLEEKDQAAVAIVGSRRATRAGLQLAGQIAAGLVRQGLTVVSGFARGVDSAAHRAAIEAGGRTLAVFGNGLGTCYPPENKAMFAELPSHGALISELPVDAEPRRENFPPRNRIVAGMCLGVVVIDAPARSGALITARSAMDSGREVFAVPGQVVGGRSAGCHQLIKDGAALVENEWDVLQHLTVPLEQIRDEMEVPQAAAVASREGKADNSMETQPLLEPLKKKKLNPVLTEDEQKVWKILPEDPVHIDQLSRDSGLDISKVSRILLGLQLKQLVIQSAGMQFCKAG